MTRSILKRVFRPTTPLRSAGARAPWKAIVATAALALGASSAAAAIIAVLPAIVYSVPASVVLDQTESDTQLIAFDERQCFRLDDDLTTDDGVIPKHTRMSSHFIHGDRVVGLLLSGRVKFDDVIIGVISTSAQLDATDEDCGRPGVDYPAFPSPPGALGAESHRGLESGGADAYQISPGGRSIEVTFQVPEWSDQIRVFTRCDTPCAGDLCPETAP